jgi:RNA polymerase sigma factor (sigma-70 family)
MAFLPDRGRAAGREERFAALVSEYARLVRSVVRRTARGASAALGEEIEQRIFTDLWKRLGREEAIDHPSSYVYRAAVRETVRALRQEAAQGGEGLDGEPAAGGGDDPHHRLAARELGNMIEEEIARLPPERERAVRLHLGGFDVQEIMAVQGWPYHKARNLVARGMADVRERLRKRGVRG